MVGDTRIFIYWRSVKFKTSDHSPLVLEIRDEIETAKRGKELATGVSPTEFRDDVGLVAGDMDDALRFELLGMVNILKRAAAAFSDVGTQRLGHIQPLIVTNQTRTPF